MKSDRHCTQKNGGISPRPQASKKANIFEEKSEFSVEFRVGRGEAHDYDF